MSQFKPLLRMYR